jgi:hypothetical protein
MKTFLNFLLGFFILTLFSCQVEKRIHRDGWYINRSSTPAAPARTEKTLSSSEVLLHTEQSGLEAVLVTAGKENIPFLYEEKKSPLNIDNAAFLAEEKEEIQKEYIGTSKIKDVPSVQLDDGIRFFLIMAAFLFILMGIVVLRNTGLNPGLFLFGLALSCIFLAVAPDWISDPVFYFLVSFFRGLWNILVNWR